jgi:hypothetical protein
MMLFTDPGCGPCNALFPEVGRWQREHAQKLTLALVSRGDPEKNKTKAQEHSVKNVLVQKDWEVSESYDVRGTPSAVLVSPDEKVASPVAGGAEGIRALLSHAVGEALNCRYNPSNRQPKGSRAQTAARSTPTGPPSKPSGWVRRSENQPPRLGSLILRARR